MIREMKGYTYFFLALTLLLCWGGVAETAIAAENVNPAVGTSIVLPEPDRKGGIPLQKALAQRKSTRKLGNEALTLQQTGDLLWSVWGTNRDNGRRTAPSARNTQNGILYAARPDGIWEYDAKAHALKKVSDFSIGTSYNNAPLVLVYAAEDSRYGAMLVGSMYQNAGLYCASAGLAGVVKASGIDDFPKHIPLPNGYVVMVIQPVGKAG